MHVIDACQNDYAAHKDDCSGFVKAVTASLQIRNSGFQPDDLANAIVDKIRAGAIWTPLADGVAAEKAAAAGYYVLAGLRGDELNVPQQHGHLAIIVGGLPLNRGKYPFGFWGSLGGPPGYDQTLNYAWLMVDIDKVTYLSMALPAG